MIKPPWRRRTKSGPCMIRLESNGRPTVMWNTTEPDIIAATIIYVATIESTGRPIGHLLPMTVSFVPTKEQPLDANTWTSLLTLDQSMELTSVLKRPTTGDTHHCEYIFTKVA